MIGKSVQIIRDEHMALAAVLRSLTLMIKKGPAEEPELFFDVVRAMLFYIDEFPERLHHTKESELLFAPLLAKAPHLAQDLDKLASDHVYSEGAVKELQHLLLAWELLGDSRRKVFESTVEHYVTAYLNHMRLEETVVIPEAEKNFTAEDWAQLDAAFEKNCDPLTGKYPREPLYDRLYTRIVMRAPAPIGMG